MIVGKKSLTVLLVVLACSLAFAVNQIKVESVEAPPGEAVAVRILLDNEVPLLGVSFAGTWDDGLTFQWLNLGEAFDENHANAEWSETIIRTTDPKVFGMAVITDFQEPFDWHTLPAGTDHHGFTVCFATDPDLPSGTVLNIDLRDDLVRDPDNPDSPPIKPVFTNEEGRSITPELVDGTITVVSGPTISSITPDRGPTSGGTEVTILGANFTEDVTVTLGGTALQDVTVESSTRITGRTPSHAAGTVDLVVSNDYGTATLENAFTYVAPPAITSVSPNQGRGDVNITITGENFTDDATVYFGSTELSDVDVVSETQIDCHIPSCGETVGWVSIKVTTVGGEATLDQGYECLQEQPEITFRRGDANCDSAIDIADAVSILGYLFGGGSAKCLDALDANDDGNVDIADAVYVLSFLFAGGAPMPPPFPDLGTDPTEDNLDCAEQCGS